MMSGTMGTDVAKGAQPTDDAVPASDAAALLKVAQKRAPSTLASENDELPSGDASPPPSVGDVSPPVPVSGDATPAPSGLVKPSRSEKSVQAAMVVAATTARGTRKRIYSKVSRHPFG